MPDRELATTTDTSMDMAAELIRRAHTITVITHTAPDADAIGGLLGLTLALRSIGAQATPACGDEVAARFHSMPGSHGIVQTLPAPTDLLIALDCGDRERLGSLAAATGWQSVPILNIDHHVTNTRFGAVNWVDTEATATSELVLRLIDRLGIALTPDIATNLLHGIIGDTLGFRTPHTTPRALECAMRLMAAGANLAEIMDQQFNQRSYSLLCLWARALDNMRLEPAPDPEHARVIWTQLSQAARQACQAHDWGNNGLSSFLVSADEADVSAVIIEKDDGQIDVSLRAKRPFDVSQAARSLGGGGHPLAAGATLDGPLDAAVERVLAAVKAVRRIEAQDDDRP